MKHLTYCLVALAALAMSGTSCSSSSNDKSTAADNTAETEAVVETAAAGEVIDLTDDNLFRPGCTVERPAVLDFNAVWCVPCKKLTPAVHAAAKTYAGQVDFYNVDIDKNKATAEAYGIQTIPCVIIIAPDGSMQRYNSLEDFAEGVTEQTTADELTGIFTTNLEAKVASVLN